MTLKNRRTVVFKTLKTVATAVFLVAFVVLTVILAPKIVSLREPAVRDAVRDKVKALGVRGIVAVFLLQVLQVIIAFLPGEPVELLIGFLYGTFGGLALCIAGIATGTVLIFTLAHKLGKKDINAFIDSEMYKKLSFLRDPLKRDAMFFLLLLIPDTPKDALTYFAPLTRIPLSRFIVISSMARIPSLISSTYVGSNISEGNFAYSALVFVLAGVLGLVGIAVYNRVIAHHRAKSRAKQGRDGK